MTPRQARRERRAAERKTRKSEIRRTKADLLADPDLEHYIDQEALATADEIGFVSQNSVSAPEPAEPVAQPQFVSQNAPATSNRAAINRANAQHSTGPRTADGKLASSRNSTKHGLASGQLIIPGEDPTAFESLLTDLLNEHQPATPTEQLLVEEMAQSHWLAQRAICLQNTCFTENGVDEKHLALFLRYGVTHHRAFHKALAVLQRQQKERRKLENGFVPQAALNRHKGAAAAGFVSQNSEALSQTAAFVPQNDPARASAIGFVSQTASSTPQQGRHTTAKAA